MKKIFILSLFMLLCLIKPVTAKEMTTEDFLIEQTKDMQQYIDLPSFSFTDTVKEISSGKWSLNGKDIINNLLDLFFGELFQNINILIKIVVVALMAGILYHMQHSLNPDGVGEMSFLVCYMVIAGITVSAFSDLVSTVTITIDNMLLFMQVLVPTLIGIISAGGAALSGAAMSPALFICMQAINYISKNFFLPLILILTALTVINHMSGRFHITKLLELGKHFLKWSSGILLTIFVGTLGLQGFSSAFVDGVAGKTVKYAISSFVPVVGGLLSDSVEAVFSSTAVVKNALGITGILTVLGICLSPLLKLFVISILYRFAAGITEPVTDKRITKMLSGIADNITLTMVILLMVSVMFIISIGMLCLVSNIPLMIK